MAGNISRESVLLNLRSVTQSCKGGVPIGRLDKDYRDLLGSSIPFRELGYNSLKEFIKDIPNVITLKTNIDGELVAEGVADSSTAHITSLVSRQKSDNKKKFRRKIPSSSYSSRNSNFKNRRSSFSPSGYLANESIEKKSINIPTVSHHSKRKEPPAQSFSKKPIKRDIAPRFLKLQNGSNLATTVENNSSLHCDNSISLLNMPSNISSSSDGLSSPTFNTSNRLSSPTFSTSSNYYIDNDTAKINLSYSEPNFGFLDSESKFADKKGLSYPPADIYAIQSQPLEPNVSAKEFIDLYAKRNNIVAEYHTILMGQKAKNKYYVSTLILGEKKYPLYPDQRKTKELAEVAVAEKAMNDIKKGNLLMYSETSCQNEREIEILVERIKRIVYEKPSGIFQNGIISEYKTKFNETLPHGWLDLIRKSGAFDVEELDVSYGRVPEGAKYIILPKKEVSSGSCTPSSTCSKTEDMYSLDVKSLKQSLVDISAQKVPEFRIPKGDMWELYITYVDEWFSARIVDYNDDDFLPLSKKMTQYYMDKNFCEINVCKDRLYAAYINEDPNVWHRVLVEKVEGDKVSCYFVDEGDFDLLERKNLQEINPDFLNVPFQAIHLQLDELNDYIKQEILENNVLGQVFIAKIHNWHDIDFFPGVSGIHRKMYTVTLYGSPPEGSDENSDENKPVNINKWLIKESLKESLVCKLPKLSTSSCAYISHIMSDGLVYLRLTSAQDCLIEQELQKLYHVFEEACLKTHKILKNALCVAKYKSLTWHRALVTENPDPELYQVFFVDYGNVEIVGKNEICELKPYSEFLSYAPYQAICCKLYNALPSPSVKWTEAATLKLMELAPFNQELIVRVMSEGDEKNYSAVSLYKRNKDLNIISINDSIACNPSLFQNGSSAFLPEKV